MKNLDLSIYGITGATEIVHNPSYEELFVAETDPALEGFEKGQETELGAVIDYMEILNHCRRHW